MATTKQLHAEITSKRNEMELRIYFDNFEEAQAAIEIGQALGKVLGRTDLVVSAEKEAHKPCLYVNIYTHS